MPLIDLKSGFFRYCKYITKLNRRVNGLKIIEFQLRVKSIPANERVCCSLP